VKVKKTTGSQPEKSLKSERSSENGTRGENCKRKVETVSVNQSNLS